MPALDKRSAPSVLTPHDGEYARLAGAAPGPDRLAAARALAAATGAVGLRRARSTAVADPGGADVTPDAPLSDAGGPALATAGSGDALSGIIGAFWPGACRRSRRRRWRPTCTGGRRTGAAGPAWWPGTCPGWWRRCCRDLTVAEGAGAGAGAAMPLPMRLAPEAGEVTMAQGRSRPAWAEIDLAAVTHNVSVLSGPGRPGPAVRGR